MSSEFEALREDASAEQLPDPSATREVAAWVTLLLRTIKTCRLYDAANPNVARFRQELTDATGHLLDRHGALRIDMHSSAMTWQEQPVFESHSRDDNLAGTFHRDGVRALTFLPGMAAEEVQSLLDLLLRVTGPAHGDDDLVTLLWEANLPHVEVSAVPLEGEVDGAADAGLEETGPAMPWPDGAVRAEAAAHPVPSGGEAADSTTRSDDWASVDGVADPETVFEELEAGSAGFVERFDQERRAAHTLPLVTAVAEILGDALEAGSTAEDRAELAAFVPRLLREAIAQGEWSTAAEALRLLRACAPEEPLDAFLEGIRAQPSPVTHHAVAALDRQGDDAVEAFVDFALAMGPPAANWLMAILAESEQRRVRQRLAKAIAGLVREQPEVLLPWLSDERWYVVRNVVHIYSQIGGEATGGFVKAVMRHPEPRVRREVVDVLGRSDPDTARQMLTAMLEGAEPRLYATIIQRLAQDPAPEVAGVLLAAFAHEAFARRTEEEKRAVLMALATRGDAALEALEAELNRGGLFSRGDDSHWQALALCIARIGTPAALAVLERGAKSAKPGARKACAIALAAKGGSGA
jgi:hypothetical protein